MKPFLSKSKRAIQSSKTQVEVGISSRILRLVLSHHLEISKQFVNEYVIKITLHKQLQNHELVWTFVCYMPKIDKLKAIKMTKENKEMDSSSIIPSNPV